MSFSEAKAYYNGYQLNYKLPGKAKVYLSVYSPKSIVDSMLNQQFGNYWNQTETYEALSVYIKANVAGVKDAVVKMLAGDPIHIMVDTFQNDLSNFTSKDQLFTLLIHLGYLTYDDKSETVRIPNREVAEVFKLAALDSGMGEVARQIAESKLLLEDVWKGNTEKVARAIDKAHDEVALIDYSNENALKYTLSLSFYYARNYYTVHYELPGGKGFADMVYIPRKTNLDKPAMVIELKCNSSSKAAITQIKEKNYPASLASYKGNLLLVGINYSKKSKKHSCRIVKALKSSS
jgi:hypothetical protein